MTTSEFYYNDVWKKTLNAVDEANLVAQDTILYLKQSKLINLSDEAVVRPENFLSYVCLTSQENKSIIENCMKDVLGTYLPLNVMKYNETETETIKKGVLDQIGRPLEKNFTFGNFVVGRSNSQANIASMTVATNLGLYYNPLFIYGNSGLGKTHLLNAIGNLALERNLNTKICYLSGLDFVEGVAKSIKDKTIDEFKDAFNNLDLLLVDDIQFIAGKEKTHEVFFTIFNNLVNNRKQICLTADKRPVEIKGLEDRIISRFNQGLNVNIEAPDFETRFNILKTKISNTSFVDKSIDEEVLSYIASNFSKDVRSLEGAITRLLFYSINFAPDEETITLKIAQEAFKDQITENKNELSIKQIKKVVCDYYNLTNAQIISKNRTSNIATARHIAIFLCRRLLDVPYEEIGKEFGNRDHSTIITSYRKVEKEIKSNSLYLKAINEIENLLKK